VKGPGDLSPAEREAVGAVVLRHAARLVVRRATKGPGAQVLGQGREAFAAKNHADMLPPRLLLAAVDHDEVVAQVRERLPCDHHAQLVSMGEVGPTFDKRGLRKAGSSKSGAHVSRLRRLAEDDAALGAAHRPPLPHPPLQGAPNRVVGERQRMRALKVVPQGDRLQRAVHFKQRKKINLPIAFK